MNYLPFVGWGFYGATSANERAVYFSSWGLLSEASEGTSALSCFTSIYNLVRRTFIGKFFMNLYNWRYDYM